MKISAVIYSYKNKNLRGIVDSLISNTASDISVNIYDQHPIDRKEKFLDINYTHVFWDKIKSPCEYKAEFLINNSDDYVLILSDDVVVSKNWDIKLIDFIKDKNIIVSGMGNSVIKKTNNFYYEIESTYSDQFLISNIANTNFMFAHKDIWNKFSYPYYLKYHGEWLGLSLNAFRQNIDIYSAPSDIYSDLGERTIETLYTPFSKDHKYNKLMSDLKFGEDNENNKYYRTSAQFLNFHNIDREAINLLPYENNDVLYEPTNLNFQDVDHRKFLERVNRIS